MKHGFHALSAVLLAVVSVLLASPRVGAQGPDSEASLEAAIRSAREFKASLAEKYASEEAERSRKLADMNADGVALSQQQARLQQELEAQRVVQYELELELEKQLREDGSGKQQVDSLLNEVATQAQGLMERLGGSLLVAQDPELAMRARTLAESQALLVDDGEAEAVAQSRLNLTTLLDLYGVVLRGAYSAGRFEAPVKLATGDSPIESCEILRCGLLVGFYHHESSGESGFLLPGVNAGAGYLEGQGKGLSTSQREKIAAVIRAPREGGYLPFDVSGGAGVATLGATDSLERWFEKGGFFMWPLLVAAALALLVVLERGIMLTFRSRGLDRQIQRLLDFVRKDRLDEADAYAAKIGGAAGAVFAAALSHRDRDRSVLEDAVQETLLHQTPIFQKRLAFIALCAAVAPLIGLLGTVTGMIETFKAVTLYGTSDPRNMAGGIATALITTQAGLYLAIPCLLARGILGAVADRALGRIETGAMSVVLTLLKRQESAAEIEHSCDESSVSVPSRSLPPDPTRSGEEPVEEEVETIDSERVAEAANEGSGDEEAEERLGLQGV